MAGIKTSEAPMPKSIPCESMSCHQAFDKLPSSSPIVMQATPRATGPRTPYLRRRRLATGPIRKENPTPKPPIRPRRSVPAVWNGEASELYALNSTPYTFVQLNAIQFARKTAAKVI